MGATTNVPARLLQTDPVPVRRATRATTRADTTASAATKDGMAAQQLLQVDWQLLQCHAAVRLQRHHQPAALHPLHILSWGGRQRPARYAYSTCLFVCVCSYAMRATVKRGIPVMHVSLCDCCSCWPCLKQCCTAYRCCRALSAPPSLSLPACRICNAYRHL